MSNVIRHSSPASWGTQRVTSVFIVHFFLSLSYRTEHPSAQYPPPVLSKDIFVCVDVQVVVLELKTELGILLHRGAMNLLDFKPLTEEHAVVCSDCKYSCEHVKLWVWNLALWVLTPRLSTIIFLTPENVVLWLCWLKKHQFKEVWSMVDIFVACQLSSENRTPNAMQKQHWYIGKGVGKKYEQKHVDFQSPSFYVLILLEVYTE